MNYKIILEKLATPRQILLADPLRDSTRLKRRNLLISTMIVLVAASYGVDKFKLPLISLPSDVILGAVGCVMSYYLIGFLISYIQDTQAWFVAQRNVIGKEQLDALSHLSQRMSEIEYEIKMAASKFVSYERVMLEKLEPILLPVKNIVKDKKDKAYNEEEINEISKIVIALNEMSSSVESNVISDAVNGVYRGELKRLTGAIGYFEDSSKNYDKMVKLIKRESFQLRVMQYLIHFGWEAVLPVFLFLIAIDKSREFIVQFFRSLY